MTRPQDVPTEALAIGLCGPEHRAEQARLFNACFKKTLEASALTWRYDLNPHGGAVSLVVRPPDGEGICGYACSPRMAVPAGDDSAKAPIGQTGDVMTHPEWRKRGIFSGLDRRCMAETAKLGWPIVFGLPNRRSAHIFLELGWERIGSIRPWTFAIKDTPEARAVRRVDGRLRAWKLPLDVSSGRKARRRLRGAVAGRLGSRGIERFDDEVEELSREIEPGFALMVRRDADYLNWRFIDTSFKLHTALGIYNGQGRLEAYVVVQAPQGASPVGFLVDVLARDEVALGAAIDAGIGHLQSAGAALVQASAIDGSWWEVRLRGAGFKPPRSENHLIVIRYIHQADHPLAQGASEASSWYLTDGDRDDETMG